MLHVFNSLGTGGLTPPSRRRRGTRSASIMNMGGGNGYTAGYSTGGIGPMYDTKMGGSMTGPIGGTGSFRAGSVEGAPRSLGGPGSVHNLGTGGGPGSIGGGEGSIGPASPLMGSGAAGIGAGGGGAAPTRPGNAADTSGANGESHQYRAKALYNCECTVVVISGPTLTDVQTLHHRTTPTRYRSQRARSSRSSTRTGNGGRRENRTGRSEVRIVVCTPWTSPD